MIQEMAESIVKFVNEQTSLHLTFVRLHGTDKLSIICKDDKGRDMVIVGYHLSGHRFAYTVRSILQRNRKDRSMTWLINGQPDKNAYCIKLADGEACWNEGDLTYWASKEIVDLTWQQELKDPAHLEEAKQKGFCQYPWWLS